MLAEAFVAAAVGLIGSFDHGLGRVDADTLEPLGPRTEIAEPHARGALSPDGERLAVGVSESSLRDGPRVGLWIVDPETMAVVQRVGTGIAAEAVAYPGVVAALLQNGELVIVNPATGDVIRRRRLGASPCFPRQAARFRGGAAFAVVGAGRRVRLAIVGASGRVRVARLGRLRPGAGCGDVGVAVDPARRRAYVAAGAQVADVALGTLRARYRATGGPVGGARTAAWLPGVGLAVAGRGLGLRVFGARRWRLRWRDRRAESVKVDGDAVVAIGDGLRVYGRDGRRRFGVRTPGDPYLEVAAGRAYVATGRWLRVYDLTTGAVRARHPPTLNSFWLLAP